MIYTNTTFTGHYPVGTAAIVQAPNRKAAAKLLEKELKGSGLEQEILPESMTLFKGGCVILNNGDY